MLALDRRDARIAVLDQYIRDECEVRVRIQQFAGGWHARSVRGRGSWHEPLKPARRSVAARGAAGHDGAAAAAVNRGRKRPAMDPACRATSHT